MVDVFDDDAFAEGVESVVQRLALAAPLAIRGMKANFIDAEQMGFGDYIEVETRRHQQITASEDTTEAFRAFVEKRTPVFRGR